MMIDLGNDKYVQSTEVEAVWSETANGQRKTIVQTKGGYRAATTKWSPKDLALEINLRSEY
jgi:hypothetical protein